MTMILDINSVTTFHICSIPVDMRKGRDKLAAVVRDCLSHNPKDGRNAYIFYSKDCKVVKILHHDGSGYEIYAKWFDDGRFLRPEFSKAASTHRMDRALLLILLTGAAMTKLHIA